MSVGTTKVQVRGEVHHSGRKNGETRVFAHDASGNPGARAQVHRHQNELEREVAPGLWMKQQPTTQVIDGLGGNAVPANGGGVSNTYVQAHGANQVASPVAGALPTKIASAPSALSPEEIARFQAQAAGGPVVDSDPRVLKDGEERISELGTKMKVVGHMTTSTLQPGEEKVSELGTKMKAVGGGGGPGPVTTQVNSSPFETRTRVHGAPVASSVQTQVNTPEATPGVTPEVMQEEKHVVVDEPQATGAGETSPA